MTASDDTGLQKFHALPRPLRILRARARLIIAILVGLAVLVAQPGAWRLVTRLLIAWDTSVALYLTFALFTFARIDAHKIRRNAVIQDDGRFLVLIMTGVAAFASLGAIVFELGGGAARTAWQLAFVTLTIFLSWAAVHTTFALHYAHDYYRGTKPGGLAFPGDEQPDYWDFVYFSFVVGMTAQVSDVGITSKTIRRTATAHGIVAFVFNTALLALMINLAAGAL